MHPNNSQLGLRVKQRSVLSFSTPGGMSRAMSAMRVETPGGAPVGTSQPGASGSSQQDLAPAQGLEGVMSQGAPMFTPDFITPADAQFAVNPNFDPGCEKENLLRGDRPSPVHLSPVRSKRPRFGFDPSCLSQDSQLGVGSQPGGFSGGSQGYGLAPPPNGSSQPWASSLADRGECSGGAAPESVFRVPAPRAPPGAAGRASIPRAAQSPPCARNPFLPAEEQPAEVPAHGRSAPANGTSNAAAYATMSRLRLDFVERGVVGRGGFCKVIKVISRLDGAEYAVKRTERKLRTERERREALREAQAMAGLGSGPGCEHVVRYYGCWMEYDHLYMRLELCEETLADRFARARERWEEAERERGASERGADANEQLQLHSRLGVSSLERELLVVLEHACSGLAYAHSRGVAHLDVKPDNILYLRSAYKLADWGRAAPLDGVGYVSDTAETAEKARSLASVEEGDARYLAPELLRGEFRSGANALHAGGGVSERRGGAVSQEESPMAATGGGSQGANRFGFGAAGAPSPTPFLGVGDSPAAQKSAPDGDGATTMETEGSDGGTPARSNRGSAADAAPPGLDRADVFSLGATAYELARGAALPSGGEAYQALRRGEMDPLDARAFGSAFRAVVAGMLRENPAARPSAAEVKAEVIRVKAEGIRAAPGGGGDGVAGIAGGSSVIGLFSPAVPESTQKEPIAARGGLGSGAGRAPRAPELRSFAGTPSRLGFQGEPADEEVTDG